MLIYGISKDVLYRMIWQGLIPSYNFGQRLTRLSRQYMDEHFKTKAGSRKRKKEALSFEPKDCYTIGEITKKFHINGSSVFRDIPKIGKFKATNSLRVSCLFISLSIPPKKNGLTAKTGVIKNKNTW